MHFFCRVSAEEYHVPEISTCPILRQEELILWTPHFLGVTQHKALANLKQNKTVIPSEYLPGIIGQKWNAPTGADISIS
jgi:hypothetical protein